MSVAAVGDHPASRGNLDVTGGGLTAVATTHSAALRAPPLCSRITRRSRRSTVNPPRGGSAARRPIGLRSARPGKAGSIRSYSVEEGTAHHSDGSWIQRQPSLAAPAKGACSKGSVQPRTPHSKRPRFNEHARLGESWGGISSTSFLLLKHTPKTTRTSSTKTLSRAQPRQRTPAGCRS